MRDVIIIAVACLIAIGVGAWLFYEDSTSLTGGAETGPVAFSVVAEGDQSGNITERKNYRIKNREELDMLWSMMYLADGPSLPDIDFEKNELLAVFDGTHTTGGYDVRIVSVVDDDMGRNVTITRVVPGESCITTEATTSPYEIIVLPKSPLPIGRNESMETVECE